MTHDRPSRRALFSTLTIALTAVSCGGSGGITVVHHEPPVVFEQEPNDHAETADYMGPMRHGSEVWIEGHVSDCCTDCCDTIDGFAFDALEPVEIYVELDAHDPWADLDVCIYDPGSDVYVDCFEGPFDPEVGAVAYGLPAEFHVVVNSAYGDSGYTLYVETVALPYGASPATEGGGADSNGPLASPAAPRARADIDADPSWNRYRQRRSEREPDETRAFLLDPEGGAVLPLGPVVSTNSLVFVPADLAFER